MEGGHIVVHRIRTSERTVAIDIWFHTSGVASFWRQAREVDPPWKGFGSLLRMNAIKYAIDRGDEEIDMLRGDERYKFDWVDMSRPLWRLQNGRLKWKKAMTKWGSKLRYAPSDAIARYLRLGG